MLELDFLRISDSSKSGDAIAGRFTRLDTRGYAIIVVDGGFTDFGDDLLHHINTYYGAGYIDVVVSTHPDADHIGGLFRVLEQGNVRELLLHLPSRHGFSGEDTRAEVADELAALARRRGVIVTEPFAALSRFGGALTVVGPSEEYYESLLAEQTTPITRLKAAEHAVARTLRKGVRAVRNILAGAPSETLTDDDGGTSPRNNTSVLLQLMVDGRRALLTGDAGVPALTRGLDHMEGNGYSSVPLNMFQAPHHGSRHNVDAAVLNRLLGYPDPDALPTCSAIVSASQTSPDHPSPKVTNALKRRRCVVVTTERASICHSWDAPQRPGWSPASAEPWLDETQD